MRHTLLLLSSFIAIATLAQLPISPKAKQKADQQLLSDLKKHIGYLASDALEGRRTGTRGEEKAIAYLAGRYKALGLRPMGDANTYIQTFEINEGREIKAGTALSTDGEALTLNKDHWPFAFSKQNASFAGVVATGDQPVSGRPWRIDIGPALEGNKNNPHFDLMQYIKDKVKEAAGQQATALLVYNASAIKDSLEFAPKDRSDVATIPVWYVSAAAMKKIDLNAGAVAGNVVLGDKTRKGHNVVAYIDNGAPNTVILGGHLDHLGYGEDHNSRNTGEPAIHNGADDNASGTSAVVALAGILKQRSVKDPSYQSHNYCFINFSGEELGLYGSKYFTEHPTIDMSKVNYMINMDMIGRFSDSSRTVTIGGVGTSDAWGELLGIGKADGPFTIKVDSSGTGPSDHTSFYRKDIPVLFYFTGLHTDYHKPSDDADKINYKGEVLIIDHIADLIARANDRGKLTFSKTKEQSMGTGRFRVSIGIMPDYTFSGQGVRADGVVDGKAAQKAGLKAGDVIVQLGEHLVTSVETYMQALNRFNKGDSTKVIVRRGKDILEFPVTF